jgi:hypothetical protein
MLARVAGCGQATERMNWRIVADGKKRLGATPEQQERLRALREAIRERYAREMAEAGFFRRLRLRWRMWREFRREAQPAPGALFMSWR